MIDNINIGNEGILSGLISFAKTLSNNRVKRNDIITNIDNINRFLDNDFFVYIDNIGNSSEELLNSYNTKTLNNIIGSNNTKQSISYLNSYCYEIRDIIPLLKEKFIKGLPFISTSKSINYRSYVYCNFTGKIYCCVMWYSTFLYLTFVEGDDKNPRMFSYVSDNLYTIVNFIKNTKGRLKKLIVDISNYSDANVDYDDLEDDIYAEMVIENIIKYRSDNTADINITTSEFKGNPIFTFRIWLVEQSIKLIELLEDMNKASMLALKKKQEQLDGETDPDKIKLYNDQIRKYNEQINNRIVKIDRIKNIT